MTSTIDNTTAFVNSPMTLTSVTIEPHSTKRSRQMPLLICAKMQKMLEIAMIRPLVIALLVLVCPGVGAAELLPELKATIAALDQSASERNLDRLTGYFAPQFKNGDGITLDQLKTNLTSLWSRYDRIEYQTKIDGWEQKDSDYIVKTTTKIKGLKPKDKTDFVLEAQISAEQTYRKNNSRWQIVSQNILAEQSTLRSGEDPPQVELRLPQQIGVGRNYAFDAIITKPLGNSLVLGATFDEAVNANNYFRERSVDLVPLRAGGIFKIGSAPFQPGNRWISAVLVQEGGITIVSQRLRVSTNFTGNQYTPLPDLPNTRRLQPKAPKNL